MDDFDQTKPPMVLDYGKAKPLGYKAIQKLTRFFPISALPNTDIVRFIINSNGYWDPYSSYLRFTVSVNSSITTQKDIIAGDTTNTAAQLDNSASSLIQTLSFIQNGVEIERIDRYEVLASILNDMFYSKEQRAQRAHQGFGLGLPSELTGIRKLAGTGTTYLASSGIITGQASSLGDGVALAQAEISGQQSYMIDRASGTDFNIPASQGTATFNSLTLVAGANHFAIGNPSIATPSPLFDGAGEPIISGTTDKKQITFCVPIISGIFGVLMPADEIKYIPMQFFPNLEMNFRLNPFAFHNLNPSTAARNFQVNSCELFVNIIHFAPEINSSIASIVKEKGLYLHTCSYYQGPSHMIPASGSFETYPINMSFKSLRTVLWSFIPSDYRSKPYIRELRRKALNLTSAQIRVGGDLFPTFPVGNLSWGHSGLPRANADFLVNTYKAMGRLHDTVNDSLVNSHTFCCGNYLTSSHYNSAAPSAAAAGIPIPALARGYTSATSEAVGYEGTAIGDAGSLRCGTSYNNWLINQIVPRAVFGIDLDTITSDDSVISGVNTLVNKPFELLLEGTNPTNEACEIVLFMYYDMVVMIDTDYTVKYLGRGG